MYLHGTSKINDKNHLEIGGVDTVDLAKKYDDFYMQIKK
mgnify:CR=1 FL=1